MAEGRCMLQIMLKMTYVSENLSLTKSYIMSIKASIKSAPSILASNALPKYLREITQLHTIT